MYVSLCFIMDNGIQLVLVSQLDISVPVLRPMIMEFLSSCSILFLFSAYFHAFYRILSFNALGSNSYNNDITVAKPRFSVWHSAWRSPIDH